VKIKDEDDADAWIGFAKVIYAHKIDSWSDDKLRAVRAVIDKEIESRGDNVGGGEDDDSVFDVLDQYDVEYQSERRHGKQWVQIRAGYEISPHIVDGLRRIGYRLHGFASDTTMNFEKVDDDSGGVRGRQEIEEKLEELEERHGTTVGDDEYGVVIHNEEERKALEWVLGGGCRPMTTVKISVLALPDVAQVCGSKERLVDLLSLSHVEIMDEEGNPLAEDRYHSESGRGFDE